MFTWTNGLTWNYLSIKLAKICSPLIWKLVAKAQSTINNSTASQSKQETQLLLTCLRHNGLNLLKNGSGRLAKSNFGTVPTVPKRERRRRKKSDGGTSGFIPICKNESWNLERFSTDNRRCLPSCERRSSELGMGTWHCYTSRCENAQSNHRQESRTFVRMWRQAGILSETNSGRCRFFG